MNNSPTSTAASTQDRVLTASLSASRTEKVIRFWFDTLEPKQWFSGSVEVDRMIENQFGDLLAPAVRGELWHWRQTALGRLAEILILDQFTRNCFRGTAKAFSGDAAALILSQEAVDRAMQNDLTPQQQHFLYMPFMHAESHHVHQVTRPLFVGMENEMLLKHFDEHADVVAQFGRYPSRNTALGRDSTSEELAYLENASRWGQ